MTYCRDGHERCAVDGVECECEERQRPAYEAGFDGRCTMCAETGECPACDGDGCSLCGSTGDCPECGGSGRLDDGDDADE